MSVKIGRKISALKRANHHLSSQAKRLFLSSVILPDFDYACTSFATGISSAARSRLAALERRALWVACDAGYTEDCYLLYEQLRITPLEERWCTKFAITAYQCTHGLRAPAICNLLTPARVSTRLAATSGVVPPRSNTKFGTNSFSTRASLFWNSLPADVRSSSLSQFKLLFHLSKP